MVKTIQKSIISQKSSQKRIRGVKTRINSNKSKKKVKRSPIRIQPNPLDINYYVKSKIDLLLSEERNTLMRLKHTENEEYSEIRKEVSLKYKPEHRALAIIGLKDNTQGKIVLNDMLWAQKKIDEISIDPKKIQSCKY